MASARPSLTIASVAIGPWFDSPPRNSGPVDREPGQSLVEHFVG